MSLIGITLRMLKHTEGLLSELDSPIAQAALHDVHNARLNIETLARVVDREHSVHVTGERGGWEM
jgi:hypothetical protein